MTARAAPPCLIPVSSLFYIYIYIRTPYIMRKPAAAVTPLHIHIYYYYKLCRRRIRISRRTVRKKGGYDGNERSVFFLFFFCRRLSRPRHTSTRPVFVSSSCDVSYNRLVHVIRAEYIIKPHAGVFFDKFCRVTPVVVRSVAWPPQSDYRSRVLIRTYAIV